MHSTIFLLYLTSSHPTPHTPLSSAIEDYSGPLRANEIAQREREPGIRFFRRTQDDVPAALDRVAHRAEILANETLPGGFKKHSSIIGFGRAEIPSSGVAEALSLADYGGETRVGDLLSSSSLISLSSSIPGATRVLVPAPRSGLGETTAWDVKAIRADDVERSARALARKPNRIFDTLSAPVIMSAVSDPFVREQRELKELRAKMPPRPADRPLNFTATAKHLQQSRRERITMEEMETIRALPMMMG